jgi:hypothetical protein
LNWVERSVDISIEDKSEKSIGYDDRSKVYCLLYEFESIEFLRVTIVPETLAIPYKPILVHPPESHVLTI